MHRLRKYLVPILMVLSLGFLAGSDVECNIEDLPSIHILGYPDYDYVVYEPDPWYDWYW